MSVSCECCVLSGRGLRDGSIIRPEESYRLWCDLETSTMRRPRPDKGCCATRKKIIYNLGKGEANLAIFFLQINNVCLHEQTTFKL
jgi:hypothetical protein